MSDPILRLSGVVRVFRQGHATLEVLKGVDLTVNPGEVVALVGPSGSGKSTLLHIAGLLEQADAGSVAVGGEDCSKLGDDARTKIRRGRMGFVYQNHHLLPEFTARENIVVPQIISGLGKSEAGARADQLLETLGLVGRADHRPARLSGGEQQRVAIGRALANAPDLLLADEPTGNLDPDTAEIVFALLMKLAKGIGLAAVVATHNQALAARMDRTLRMDDGHLVEG